MKTSLFIPTWKRFKYMREVIEAWLPQVDDMTIWDDSRADNIVSTFRDHPKINVIRASKRMGSHVKFKSAQLLKNDWVIIADDDIIPGEILVQELIKWQSYCCLQNNADKENIIISIFGRRFSKDGYQSHPLQRADKITEIKEVDWAGRLLFGHRRNFMVDITACPNTLLDDLFWSFELRRQIPWAQIFVIPTKEWRNTPDSNNEFSLSRTPGYWKLRDDFVKKHYEAINGR